MLKAEYSSCGEISSLNPNPIKPVVTWSEAKKHLHEVRLRRQTQLASNIDECHRLRHLHKQLFHGQLNCSSSLSSTIEKSSSNKSIPSDYSLSINKYSIPRIEYASMIYRQALPTFEIDKSIKSENESPIVKELTQSLTECPYTVPKRTMEKYWKSICCTDSRLLLFSSHSPLILKKKDLPRRLSVSTVSSVTKQANRVYEKWPDYNRISDIVGYRIDPPNSKLLTPQPSNTSPRRKHTKSTGFPTASKQIKNLVGLKVSSNRQQSSKNKKSSTINLVPTIVEQPAAPPPPPPMKKSQSKLPTILCPSSPAYSSHIQTRQWLVRNHFSTNAMRTLPLL